MTESFWQSRTAAFCEGILLLGPGFDCVEMATQATHLILEVIRLH